MFDGRPAYLSARLPLSKAVNDLLEGFFSP